MTIGSSRLFKAAAIFFSLVVAFIYLFRMENLPMYNLGRAAAHTCSDADAPYGYFDAVFWGNASYRRGHADSIAELRQIELVSGVDDIEFCHRRYPDSPIAKHNPFVDKANCPRGAVTTDYGTFCR